MIKIQTELRSSKGKSKCRQLRKTGVCPGNIIEKGKQSIPVQFDPKHLAKAWQSEGKKLEIEYAGKTTVAKIQELQLDPVKRLPVHVDFLVEV